MTIVVSCTVASANSRVIIGRLALEARCPDVACGDTDWRGRFAAGGRLRRRCRARRTAPWRAARARTDRACRSARWRATECRWAGGGPDAAVRMLLVSASRV